MAFVSDATNLVPGDTNAAPDVFVRDTTAGTTARVSVPSSGGQANAASSAPAISGDGRYVAFASAATDLVGGDDNATGDIFLRDTAAATTTRISVSSAGGEANGPSSAPAISADAQTLAFASAATNLVSGDTNAAGDVFVADRAAGTTTRASVASGGAQANGASSAPALSGDGRYVAFDTVASNLTAGDTNGTSDVFVRDRTGGTTTRVSVDSAGTQATGPSYGPAISADGRYVAFSSDASDLMGGDTNGVSDVFEHDRTSLVTARLSMDDVSGQGNAASSSPSLSSDGTFAAFGSLASNFDDVDHPGLWDVYVHRWEESAGGGGSFSTASSSSSAASCTGGDSTSTAAPTATDSTTSASTVVAHGRCVVVAASLSVSASEVRAVPNEPAHEDDCDDGDVNAGSYPVNLSTTNLSPEDAAVLRTYARWANSWLAKAARINGGPVRLKPTKGELRTAASAAARLEREAAEAEGRPYQGQVGHVPDTAVSGHANPPCGWLDMPGTTNQKAGGPLGSRIGQKITHFTVDHALP